MEHINFLPYEEEALINRAKQGEREAFDLLYQRYKRPILNHIYRFIGNVSDAEELTQEVFVRAYIHISRFEPRSKFSSWLYKIASNLSKNYLRHSRYEKRRLPLKSGSYADGGEDTGLNEIENIEDKTKGPGELVQAAEMKKILQQEIHKLPVPLKEALILCDIQGLSYEEAAVVMACKPMTVGSRLSRAREKLAKALGHFKNGEYRK